MAHLVLTVDSDPAIRRTFIDRAKMILGEDELLQIDSAEVGDLAVVWAWGGAAPIGRFVTNNECSVLLGYAVDQNDRHLNAETLLRDWTHGSQPQQSLDGYFAAVRYSKSRGLIVDVDPMGVFPMLYYQQSGTVLAGSSGALFAAHAKFRSELDPVGLGGILLTNGLVNNRTLLKGVQHLNAGHRLVVSGEGHLSEIKTSEFHPDIPRQQSYPEIVASMNEALEAAIRRHRPEREDTTLLLSGGLDSRLVAGTLKQLGIPFDTTTWGEPTDFDARAARQVASCLEISHTIIPNSRSAERIASNATRLAQMDHLTHGFGGFQAFDATTPKIAPMFWSGYILDDTLGGGAFRVAQDRRTQKFSFETMFRKINSWGIAPETLARLMRPAFANSKTVVTELIESLRETWNQMPGSDAQKSFQMRLGLRERYHLFGAVHRMSFVSWPILPNLDLAFLNQILSVPPDALSNRQLQIDSLRMRFPELAAVPYDTNSFRFEPSGYAKASSRNRGPHRLWGSVRKAVRRWYWQQWRQIEPRRYHRIFDPDLPDWKIIRELAEPHRGRVLEWLDEQELAKLVPAPTDNLNCANPFLQGASLRTLCGLMLWNSTKTIPLQKAA